MLCFCRFIFYFSFSCDDKTGKKYNDPMWVGEGTEEVIFTVQGQEVGWSLAPRMLCRYTSHHVLVSQHARKRLRSRRMGSMLSDRPAAGVHQPPLECEWQKAGAAGEDPHGCACGTC